MNQPVTAYPLTWPAGRRRSRSAQDAKFRDGTGGKRLNLDTSRKRLEYQLDRLGKVADPILSMNIKLTISGKRDMNISRAEPYDAAVALYFDLNGRPYVLACDKWDRVADNIAAIAAHIEALRGQERWGVGTIEEAFAGHVALPAPEQWWQILGVAASADSAAIQRAWREKIADAHPDRGGSEAAAARINRARDDGLSQIEKGKSNA